MPTSRHITFANVASLLALVVALGTGGAYAANTVRSKDIVNGQVKAVDLRKNAVTTAKIKDRSIAAVDVLLASLTGDQIANNSIGPADIRDGSLGQADLGTSSVGAAEIANNTIDGGEIVDNSLFGADIANSSVGNADLANNAVDTDNVVNNSLTFSDIVGGVTTGNVSIAAGSVANGRCEQINFTVGGATVGDAVVFSVRGSMQDGVLFYGMSVLATDTVRGSLCNFSGVAQTAIADLPVRIITFR